MRIEKENNDPGSVESYRWRAGSRFAPLRSPGADRGQGQKTQNVLFNFGVD
jgi:hypothetical protein